MKRLTLDDIKEVELALLCELDRICRAHNLQYFLAYGTLLGAMRHEGFIPWDDDIDVMMPRKDYETLIAHFDEWTQCPAYSIALYRDKSSVYPFAKITDARTSVKESYVLDNYRLGVWIDLFPLEDTPRDVARLMAEMRWGIFKRNLVIGDPEDGTSAFRRAFKSALFPLMKSVDPYELAASLEARVLKAPVEDATSYSPLLGTQLAQIYPKSDFSPIEVPFEGHRFFAPVAYDMILTYVFGDWRTPPPEDQRGEFHAEAAYWL